MTLLAHSLFADTPRNRMMMLRWLTRVIDDDAVPRGTSDAAAWHTTERARQQHRASATTDTRAVMRALVPVARATLHRRAPSTARTMLAAAAALPTPTPTTVASSPVAALAALVRALLLAPVQLVLVANANDTLVLHLFGRDRLSHVHVLGEMLSSDERRSIEYVTIMAHDWSVAMTDDDDDADAEDPMVLRASALMNDVFDSALNRVALVWAVCETIMYGAGEHVRVRHVLEAALLAAASTTAVIDAGWYDEVRALAYSVRVAPLVPATHPSTRYSPDAVARAREHALRYNIVTVDFMTWRHAWR